MDSDQTKLKRIITVVLLVVIALVTYMGLLRLSRQDEIAVRINTLPEDAQVSINDSEPFKGNSTAYLNPGTYKVTVKAEGFRTTNDQIVVGNKPSVEYYMLTSDSSEADEWQRKNEKKILEFEGKIAEKASEESEEFRKKNTVTSVLPYRNVLYSIEYRAGDNDSVIVQIIADSAENRSFALQKLRELGYEPTDLKIEFPGNFINAFVEEEGDESELN